MIHLASWELDHRESNHAALVDNFIRLWHWAFIHIGLVLQIWKEVLFFLPCISSASVVTMRLTGAGDCLVGGKLAFYFFPSSIFFSSSSLLCILYIFVASWFLIILWCRTNVVLLIYTTTLVVALPMKEESLKEFHCKNSPDDN